ncbi:hypothetical protein V6N12_040724 [Hibiscus sabdariffa]|uniref:Uncharacterized protein n=1 Tax=Hibiscus sabdariffa TaxID=183260 RepID=A0ABR2E4N4_9ROSI
MSTLIPHQDILISCIVKVKYMSTPMPLQGFTVPAFTVPIVEHKSEKESANIMSLFSFKYSLSSLDVPELQTVIMGESSYDGRA